MKPTKPTPLIPRKTHTPYTQRNPRPFSSSSRQRRRPTASISVGIAQPRFVPSPTMTMTTKNLRP
ncbi:hypothetical protein F8388_017699 [Cannabis sativa]|uniref:Uncharacterized protein n=1 Tax=Cannabis sativa TaxID=3483 RepID=A0A7J6HJ40_CANSA|nr:hypothetical protein G4B88_019529 [Cannabis sativa]KAF4394971.1 hypothetical protein F8388_017699 [Cannabis sativa]